MVTRAQLEQCGLEAAGMSRWQDERRLHRVYPGVYAVGHLALGTEGKLAAALFYAGRGAALSHTTAASWWGILRAEPRRLHVTTPGKRLSLPEVRVHCRRNLECRWHKRLPLTPPDVNVRVAGWLVDAVWFDERVVVELDSHLAHGAPAKMGRDHQRDLDLRAAGYTVLRYTWQQVTATPERVVADLRRELRL